MKYLEILPSHLVMLLKMVLKCMMANGEAGRRVSKTACSHLQNYILLCTGTFTGCTPYVGLCCIWKRFALQRKSDDFDVFCDVLDYDVTTLC